MALRMRKWRQRKRDLSLLLRYSDGEEVEQEEGVVPVSWIDRNKNTIRWPNNMSATKTERPLKDKINPRDDRMTSPLIKIKITSGVKLPDYPIAPQKIPPIQDTDLLNKASPQYSSTAPQHKYLSPPKSRHAVYSCASDEIHDGYRCRSGSGSSIWSRRRDDSSRSRSRLLDDSSRSRHRDDSSRSRHGDNSSRSRHGDDSSRSRSRLLDDSSRSRHRYDSSRSRHGDNSSRSRHGDDSSRSRCRDDFSRSRSRRCDDTTRSRRCDDTTRSRRCDDTTMSRSRRCNDSSRSRCHDDSSRSRHRDDSSRSRSRCCDDTTRSRRRNDSSRSRCRDDFSRSRSRCCDDTTRSRRRNDSSRSRCCNDFSRSRSRLLDDSSRSRHRDDSSRSRCHDEFSRSRSRCCNDSSRSRSRLLDDSSRSRHRDDSSRSRCHDEFSRSRSRLLDDSSRSRHRDDSSRFRCHDEFSRSRRCDDTSRCCHHTSRSENGSRAFPLPQDVFQREVINLLIDIRSCLQHVQPTSSAVHIERMQTMEDFEREEERLCDSETFATLVLQISRIGGKDTKDFVHKVLDRLFTNALMAKFNMKGKGKRGKKSLEITTVYRAIKDGIMNGDAAATEEFIWTHAAEHLKHAPQRSGGGGHRLTQD